MYLREVIKSDIEAREPHKLYKKSSLALKRDVASFSTPIAWAKTQDDYTKVRLADLKKATGDQRNTGEKDWRGEYVRSIVKALKK